MSRLPWPSGKEGWEFWLAPLEGELAKDYEVAELGRWGGVVSFPMTCKTFGGAPSDPFAVPSATSNWDLHPY